MCLPSCTGTLSALSMESPRFSDPFSSSDAETTTSSSGRILHLMLLDLTNAYTLLATRSRTSDSSSLLLPASNVITSSDAWLVFLISMSSVNLIDAFFSSLFMYVTSLSITQLLMSFCEHLELSFLRTSSSYLARSVSVTDCCSRTLILSSFSVNGVARHRAASNEIDRNNTATAFILPLSAKQRKRKKNFSIRGIEFFPIVTRGRRRKICKKERTLDNSKNPQAKENLFLSLSLSSRRR